MRFLRQNTAVIITVGPFYDKTDGVTIETALTITNERITLTADTDDGAAPTNILDNVTGATSGTSNDLNYITGNDAGMMQMELSAANTNRVGRMLLSITDAANHVPVFHEFMVMPALVYDTYFAASGGATFPTGTLATTTNITAGTVTTATNVTTVNGLAANVITATSINADAITAAKIANGAIDAATFAADVDAEILSYLVDDATRIDASALNTASVTSIPAILVDTGTDIPASIAALPTAAANADAVWDEDATAHQTGGTFGQAIGDPGADTNTIFKAVVSDATGATVGVDVVDLKTQIGVAGAGLTAINLPDQTMNITGDITGNLSGSVGSVTGAVGSVTGAVGSVTGAVGSVTGNVGGNVTGTIGGLTAAALKDFFDTDSTTTYASAVAGSVVKEIADNAGGTPPSAATIADAVWDEVLSGHAGAGSAGEALSAAGTAGDPWTTALPGAYGAGTAGEIIGNIPSGVTLADGPHGGTSATLRLGGSGATPAFHVTNSGGTAVQFESNGGNGGGLVLAGQGTGNGLYAASGAGSVASGILAVSNATVAGGAGIYALGSGSAASPGILAAGNGAAGIRALGGTNASGISAEGTGTGHGLDCESGVGATGDGIHAAANSAGGVDIAGDLAGTLAQVTLVDTLTTYTGNILQTADVATLITTVGAAGAGLTAINLPDQTMNITGNITGNLSGSVGSVTGAVGSVTGAVGSVTGLTPATVHSDLDDIQAKIGTPAGVSVSADIAAVKAETASILTDTAEIGAAGAGLTNINLPNQTMDIVGNITGNLSGSVGSVTGLTASDVGAIKAKTDSLTFTKANEVDANIQSINGTTVNGDGSGTPWGP